MNKYKIIETGEIVVAERLTKPTSIPTGTGELLGAEGSWVITDSEGDRSVVENELFIKSYAGAGADATNAVQYKNIYTESIVDAVQASKERKVVLKDNSEFVLNRDDWHITDGADQFPVNDADFQRTYVKVEEKPVVEKHVFKDEKAVKNRVEQYDRNGDLIK